MNRALFKPSGRAPKRMQAVTRLRTAVTTVIWFCQRSVTWTVLAVIASATNAAAQTLSVVSHSYGESWYFSAAEIGAAYQYQENYGVRMRNPLPAHVCVFGKADFVTTYRQTTLRVPCQFVNEVTRHLREMLEIGAARYLFPLDADHAHLAVPSELWASKYSKFPSSQLMAALLREPKLVSLYHTAEHLDPRAGDSPTDKGIKGWKEKRNVLGFFDGRPAQILAPHPEGFGVGMPDGFVAYSGFNFLANYRGELMLFQGRRGIAFDLSLDGQEELDTGVSRQPLVRTVRQR